MVGTNNGLALFNPQSEKFITFKHIEGNENSLLSDQILDIKQMKDGTLWICTNMGGVSILNLRENTFNISRKDYILQYYGNEMTTMDYPDPMHEASYKIHSEIFGLATTAVEWILSVMHSHYSTPLPILLKNKVRSIINKYGDYGQIITKYRLGGEGELGIYEKGKKTKNFSLHECRLHPQTHINVIYQDKQRTTCARHL